MKSDRAEDYLINHECGYPMDGYVPLMEAGRAVEIAEQDAEKRMRQKATEAFKSSFKYQDGCVSAIRECDPIQFDDLRLFIQKLNEE